MPISSFQSLRHDLNIIVCDTRWLPFFFRNTCPDIGFGVFPVLPSNRTGNPGIGERGFLKGTMIPILF